jgi:hypothetical protein
VVITFKNAPKHHKHATVGGRKKERGKEREEEEGEGANSSYDDSNKTTTSG